MRIHVLAATLLCAVALAACGSSSGGHATATPTATPTTPTVTPTTPTATSTTPTATPTASSSTTTASSSPSAVRASTCRAADLAPSFLGGQGATGHGLLAFALRNTSSASCRTGGYPGVLFLDRSGRGLPTTPTHTTGDFFGHTTLRVLTVAPGHTVSFRLGVSHVGSGGSNAGCVTASGLQVIVPNDTATQRIAVHGGIAECGGTVTVSPLQTGTTALR